MIYTPATLFSNRPDGASVFAVRAQLDSSELLRVAKSLGVTCREVDGNDLLTEKALLTRVAKVLCFADFYGGNLEALNECMLDREFRPRGPTILIVHGADQVQRRGTRAGKAVWARVLDKVDAGKEESGFWHFDDTFYYPPFWLVSVFPTLKSKEEWDQLVPRKLGVVMDKVPG